MTARPSGPRFAPLRRFARGHALWIPIGLLMLTGIWGTQFLIIQVGQHDIPPLLSMALRYAVLFVAAGVGAALTGQKTPPGQRKRLLFGLLQAITMGLLYWSEGHIPSSLAAVVSMSEPFFVVIFAHLYVSGERFQARVLVAQACGFVGVSAIIIGEVHASAATDAAVLPLAAVVLSAVVTAGNRVFGKRLVESVPPLVLLRDVGWVVALTAGVAAWQLEADAELELTGQAVAAFVYLGLIASALASTLYLYLLKRLAVSTLAYIQFVTALTAVLAGALLGGERLRLSGYLGGVLVLGGLWLVARGNRASARTAKVGG